MEKFKVALAKDFKTGWALLMTKDLSTTQEVMRGFLYEHNLVKSDTEAFWTLQWMERMNTSTQAYNMAFTQVQTPPPPQIGSRTMQPTNSLHTGGT